MKPEDKVSLLIYDEPSASLDPEAEYGPSHPSPHQMSYPDLSL